MPPRRRRKGRVKRLDSLLIGLVVAIVLSLIGYFYQGDAGYFFKSEDEKQQQSVGSALVAPSDVVLPPRGEHLSFLFLNAHNYFVNGEKSRSRYTSYPKKNKNKEAVADVIAHARPDIVGLCEIGGRLALEDLRGRLGKRGLDYPYYRVLERQGEDRALALLSRYPITADNSKVNYPLYGQQRRNMLRGILDLTIQHGEGEQLRVMGVHLKSKVSDDAAAATSLRKREASTLSQHVAKAAKSKRDMPILVFGDFNDDPEAAALSVLEKGSSELGKLRRLRPRDSAGKYWTIYYRRGDSYHVFDQIYVNGVLERELRDAKSGIVDIPESREASDHRAVWLAW